jgi:hypothetical protein
MNIAHNLLDDLTGIGATIEPAGDRLILRAGPTAIPATLVSRIRQAKRELTALLVARKEGASLRTEDDGPRQDNPTAPWHIELRSVQQPTFDDLVVQWLNQHPAPSAPGHCAWCGSPESAGARVVPFGTEPWTHAWLHPECWPDWHRARKIEATSVLARMGIVPPVGKASR